MWPGVVSDDVTRHVNSLIGQVDVSEGLVAGKTILPMPVESRKILEENEDASEDVDDYEVIDGRGSSASQTRPGSSVSDEGYNTKYEIFSFFFRAKTTKINFWCLF